MSIIYGKMSTSAKDKEYRVRIKIKAFSTSSFPLLGGQGDKSADE